MKLTLLKLSLTLSCLFVLTARAPQANTTPDIACPCDCGCMDVACCNNPADHAVCCPPAALK